MIWSRLRHRRSLPYKFELSLLAVLATVLAAATVAAEDTVEIDDPDEECSTYISPEDRLDVEALTFQGVACFKAERYDWALTHYRAAYSIRPDPFLLGGIGRSLHELGIYQPASRYYQRFLRREQAPSGVERIQRRVDELEASIDENAETVSLHSAPAGATAYVVLENGYWYELGTTPLRVELRGGEYEFAFHGAGYRPRQIQADISGDHSIDAELVSEEAALNVSERRRRSAGVWTMVTSIPITAAGATMVALSAQDDDHRSLRTPGTIVSAAGMTTLLTGLIVYFSGSSEDPSPLDDSLPRPDRLTPGEAAVEPMVGIGHLGIRLSF